MSYEIKAGDKFLLCSDGLTNVLSELEITKIIKATSDDQLLDELINQTKAKGAPDNITIVWAEVVEASTEIKLTKFGSAK